MPRKPSAKALKSNPAPIAHVHSAAIHIQHQLTLLQRQLWLYLLFRAFPQLKTQDIYTVSLSELKTYLDLKTHNHQHIKSMLEELVSTRVEWNIFGKDTQVWGIAALLASCSITVTANSSTVRYSFAPDIRERLADPVMYAKINLLITRRFKSKHALGLYCLGLDYLRLKDNYGAKTFTVGELRKYLGLEPGQYPVAADFFRYVLKKAQTEINQLSDIQLQLTPIRKQREVTAFKLEMRINPAQVGLYTWPNQADPILPLDSLRQLSRPDLLSDWPELVQSFFRTHGLSAGSAAFRKRLQALNPYLSPDQLPAYLAYVVNHVQEAMNQGGIRKISGFFLERLTAPELLTQYQRTLQQNQQSKQRNREQVQSLRQQADTQALLRSFDRSQQELIQQRWDSLDADQQETMLSAVLQNDLAQNAWKQRGIQSPLIISLLRPHMLTFDEQDFEHWHSQQAASI